MEGNLKARLFLDNPSFFIIIFIYFSVKQYVMGKTLDSDVLAALHLLTTTPLDGVNYIYFVKGGIMNGVLDLIEGGYAEKIKIGEDNANYRLTEKGEQFLAEIINYASDKF
jgi:hypothetical protein